MTFKNFFDQLLWYARIKEQPHKVGSFSEIKNLVKRSDVIDVDVLPFENQPDDIKALFTRIVIDGAFNDSDNDYTGDIFTVLVDYEHDGEKMFRSWWDKYILELN